RAPCCSLTPFRLGFVVARRCKFRRSAADGFDDNRTQSARACVSGVVRAISVRRNRPCRAEGRQGRGRSIQDTTHSATRGDLERWTDQRSGSNRSPTEKVQRYSAVRNPYPMSVGAERIGLSLFNTQPREERHERTSADYVSAPQGREGIRPRL